MPATPFDFASLEVAIRTAAMRAFAEVAAAHPTETLCAFALYSDDDAMTVCPSINTRAHLAKTQREHPDDAVFYKFAAPEWRFEATGADAEFTAICDRVRGHVMAQDGADALSEGEFEAFKGALVETCVRVLASLRRESAFEDVLLTFDDVNAPAEVQLARIERLNAGPVVDEFRAWTRDLGRLTSEGARTSTHEHLV